MATTSNQSREYVLTDEMRSLFPAYVQKFTALCLHTVEPDHKFDAEFAIKATTSLFKIAGIEPPKNFFVGTWTEFVAEARPINTTIPRTTDPKPPPTTEFSRAVG